MVRQSVGARDLERTATSQSAPCGSKVTSAVSIETHVVPICDSPSTKNPVAIRQEGVGNCVKTPRRNGVHCQHGVREVFSMKAVVRDRYGPPDVLRLEEVPKPSVGDDGVLIRVRATSLNGSDWEGLRGTPLYARVFGLLKPKVRILGSDIAGQIEAVGRSVTQFQPGDEVFGDTMYCGCGGFAEYVCVPESAPLVRKPAGLTFEQVATLPQGGGLALQGIRDQRKIHPGDRVLVNGAGGSAGPFAMQIAKLHGAEVTGVDNTGKLDMLRSIGADHVVDYTREDFSRQGRRYDLILDFSAHRSIFTCRRALAPGGTYAMVGGSMSALLQSLLVGCLLSKTGSRKLGVLGHRQNREDLTFLAGLLETGTVGPVIDRRYPLTEAADALRHLGERRALGKVVITV